MLAREMQANPQLEPVPVVFAGDDTSKQGVQIHGLPVLGGWGEVRSERSQGWVGGTHLFSGLLVRGGQQARVAVG